MNVSLTPKSLFSIEEKGKNGKHEVEVSRLDCRERERENLSWMDG